MTTNHVYSGKFVALTLYSHAIVADYQTEVCVWRFGNPPLRSIRVRCAAARFALLSVRLGAHSANRAISATRLSTLFNCALHSSAPMPLPSQDVNEPSY